MKETQRLIEKLSLAFDMRAKEIEAGLHGWDAQTQYLRVAVLRDLAGTMIQWSKLADGMRPLADRRLRNGGKPVMGPGSDTPNDMLTVFRWAAKGCQT